MLHEAVEVRLLVPDLDDAITDGSRGRQVKLDAAFGAVLDHELVHNGSILLGGQIVHVQRRNDAHSVFSFDAEVKNRPYVLLPGTQHKRGLGLDPFDIDPQRA
jgi:hypothetical protein